MNGAIPQIEVDEVLIREPRLYSHLLEIGNGVAIQANRDWLLETLDVRVLAPLQPGEIIVRSHFV
jgi:hypothetical protein